MNEKIQVEMERVIAALPAKFEAVAIAHDMLNAIINQHIIISAGDYSSEQIRCDALLARSALCWVLSHDETDFFTSYLAAIEEAIEAAGFKGEGVPINYFRTLSEKASVVAGVVRGINDEPGNG